MKSPESRKKKGYVLCSLVEELQGAKPGTSFGHVLHVPGFGNIFFGELIVAQSSYRLTMMRIEMGCLALEFSDGEHVSPILEPRGNEKFIIIGHILIPIFPRFALRQNVVIRNEFLPIPSEDVRAAPAAWRSLRLKCPHI